jgi:hypothetical protein
MIKSVLYSFGVWLSRKFNPEKESIDVNAYEVDLSKKYVLVFDDFIPDKAWQELKETILNWRNSDNPVLLVRGAGGGVKLVKID